MLNMKVMFVFKHRDQKPFCNDKICFKIISIVPKEMYDSATNVIFQEMKKTICGFICSVITWGVLNKMQVL